MTDTAVELETVEPVESAPSGQPAPGSDAQLVAMLVERARSEGLQLTGQGGLLQQLTKRVLESALEGEITDHLGYERHDAVGRGSGNSRNGSRAKTVLTDVGPVEVKVPRDTSGTAPGCSRSWSKAGGIGDDASAGTVFHSDHGASRTP